MSVFIDIENQYLKDFSYFKIKDKVSELLTTYSENDLLNYFLQGHKNSKNRNMIYILPIFYLSPQILDNAVNNIIETFSERDLTWIFDELTTLVPQSLMNEYSVRKLKNSLTLSITLSHNDYDDGVTELSGVFVETHKYLKNNFFNEEIQDVLAEILKKIVYYDRVNDNEMVFDFIMEHIVDSSKEQWQETFATLLIRHCEHEKSKSKSLSKVLSNSMFFTDIVYKRLAHYFSNVDMIRENDYVLLKKLKPSILYYEKYFNFDNIFKAFANTKTYQRNEDFTKWAEIINLYEKSNADIKKYATDYCLSYWAFFKEQIESGKYMSVDSKYPHQFFGAWVRALNNQSLVNEIKEHINKYMPILLLQNHDEIKSLNVASSSFIFISELLPQFIGLNEGSKEKEFEVFRDYILVSKNNIAFERLLFYFKKDKNTFNVAVEKIRQMLSVPKFQEDDYRFTLRNFVKLLNINEHSDILLKLAKFTDSDISYIANDVVVKTLFPQK